MLPKNMFSLKDYTREDLEGILQRAAYFKKNEGKIFSSLQGKNIAISFWEPSTRTRLSFELAVQKLGGRVIDLNPTISSERKGENMEDTVRTLTSLGAHALIFRHNVPGFLQKISRHTEMPLISGGEGCYQHPSQALLDIFTLREKGVNLAETTIVMVGDILHSRVARSHFLALPLFGARLILVAPPVLLPPELIPPGVSYSYHLEEVLPQGDVIYLLRVQKERQSEGLLPSLGEYAAVYGLNEKRLSLLKEKVFLMHPGPVNVGIEINYKTLKRLKSFPTRKILFQEQVQNGVYVRMAILDIFVAGRVV